MIWHVGEEARAQGWVVTGHPLLAAWIGGRLDCPRDGVDFWVLCSGEGVVQNSLAMSGSTLYVTGSQGNGVELARFADTVGARTILSDLELPMDGERLAAMSLHRPPPSPEGFEVKRLTSKLAQLSAVEFALLQQCSGELADRREVERCAVSLSHAVRRGKAAAVAIMQEERLVAAAEINYIYRGCGVLGAVAVLPEHRGAGLGRAVVSNAALLALELGVKPLLCCKPNLTPLYKSCGFEETTSITQYRKDFKDDRFF